MFQRRSMLVAASAVAFATPGLLRAQTGGYKKEYRLSLVAPPGTLWHNAADRFAQLVRERTSGRIAIKLYPGSSLVQGAQDRELVALRQGTIDILVGTGMNWSGTVKELALFSLPFLMPDQAAVEEVLNSPALHDTLYGIMRRAGVEPLASGRYGYMQLLNSKHRLAKPGDIAGLKIRVVGTPMFQDVMTALGANPTSMSWADAQAALASGAVDGLFLTLEQVLAVKAHTLGQKNITKWNAFNEMIHTCVANPVWKSWTETDQQIVRTVAQEVSKELTQLVGEKDNSDALLKQQGVDVYTPTAAELAQWKTLVRHPYAKWKAIIGPELVNQFEAVVEASTKR